VRRITDSVTSPPVPGAALLGLDGTGAAAEAHTRLRAQLETVGSVA
jgi:hypothetical protein